MEDATTLRRLHYMSIIIGGKIFSIVSIDINGHYTLLYSRLFLQKRYQKRTYFQMMFSDFIGPQIKIGLVW